jgi:glucose dehydrogenase
MKVRFLSVVDGRIEAIDAATGKLLWSSLAIPKTEPGVISPYPSRWRPGSKGEPSKCRRRVSSVPRIRLRIRRHTGEEPGSSRFRAILKAFESKAMEATAKTWTGEWWKMGGGGSIWDGMAYDPDEKASTLA